MKKELIFYFHSFTFSTSIYWVPALCQTLYRLWGTSVNKIEKNGKKSLPSWSTHFCEGWGGEVIEKISKQKIYTLCQIVIYTMLDEAEGDRYCIR